MILVKFRPGHFVLSATITTTICERDYSLCFTLQANAPEYTILDWILLY